MKLIGCDNGKCGTYAKLVQDRNETAHCNGNIFYSDSIALDKNIAEVLRIVEEIQSHSKPVIEECYRIFLLENHDPDDHEFTDPVDQIRETLIRANYFAQADNRGPDCPHGHFAPTPLRHPPYSAAAVPFAWMLVNSMAALGEEHAIDVQPEREPDLGFPTQWNQESTNQKALLDCFAAHLVPEHSLCFFYAKQVPFVEDAGRRRILIGVGRIRHVTKCIEYRYTTKNLDGKLRSMLWELMVQHSIRPDFKDGILLPYHAALEKAAIDAEYDPAEIAAFSPDDRLLEFSHASQLVTHDGAIASLLSCADALRKAKKNIAGPWDRCLEWLDHRIGELWRARGPCPGLGAALSAFGLELGTFIARAISEKAGDNIDPWPNGTKISRRLVRVGS